MNQNSEVIIVDSIMGSGKTSFAIEFMNQHPEENFLFITPYIKETGRIHEKVQTHDFKLPQNKGNGKLGNIYKLFEAQEDIASTHSLFKMLSTDVKDAIRQGEYILILDEALSAVEPYHLPKKEDLKYLRKHSIKTGEDGYIEWIDDDLDTLYNPIKILSQNHCLFYTNEDSLAWRFPPEIFTLFKKVYVLTYLFSGSLLKYYFDLAGIDYTLHSVTRGETGYVLSDYKAPDKREIRKHIHVYDHDDLNDLFAQKRTALSSTWFKNAKTENPAKIKKLQNAIYNFFANKRKAKSGQIIWTTFIESKAQLRGKGYARSFLSCNARSTNEYADKTELCYALNVFPHYGITQFFQRQGIKIDNDKYALAEMLQWIWRSAIRNNKDIHVYIPSNRMRKLLLDWLSNDKE